MNNKTLPIKGLGQFQWSTGGWFGAQIGMTAWLVILGIAQIYKGYVLAGTMLTVCGIIPNWIGYAIWTRRDRIQPYAALQMILGIVFAFTIMAIISHDQLLSPLTIDDRFGTGRQTYKLLAIFPAMMLMFAFMERIGKRKNAQQGGPGYPPQGVGSPDP